MPGILSVDQITDSTGTRPVQFPVGVSSCFYETKALVDFSYTITTGYNAMTAGPITIADGVEITVSGDSVWTKV
jgi:hypothetical protein